MRSALAILLVIATLPSCKEKPPPPPPPELLAALHDADAAMHEEAAGQFALACETLSQQLANYKNVPGLSVVARADLQRLAMEVAAFGAMQEGRPELSSGEWKELRTAIDRVLQGQSPKPGPRYQVEMPAEVKAAIDDVDAALASEDIEGAQRSIGQARIAIANWAERMPGPRAGRLMEVAEGDLDVLLMHQSESIEELRRGWSRARARLEPGAP